VKLAINYTTLISASNLFSILSAPDCVIIDCRHDLAQPEAGRDAYQQAHIPGARFLQFTGNGNRRAFWLDSVSGFVARMVQ